MAILSDLRKNMGDKQRLLAEELTLDPPQKEVFGRFNNTWTGVINALDAYLANPTSLDLCLSFLRQLFKANDIARELSSLSTLDKEDMDSDDVDALEIVLAGFWFDFQELIEPSSPEHKHMLEWMLSDKTHHPAEQQLRDIAGVLMTRN